MKYDIICKLMWLMFKNSFSSTLKNDLKIDKYKKVMKKGKKKYKEILKTIPDFDKDDRFKINIISCAQISSILLSCDKKLSLDEATLLYHQAMSNKIMKKFSKRTTNYTTEGQENLAKSALTSQTRTNPYTWKFDYIKGKNNNEYTAIFKTCGICKLMNELNLTEYIPALCSLDYVMAEMNNTTFTREYTLASGGPYCDCHYNHRN